MALVKAEDVGQPRFEYSPDLGIASVHSLVSIVVEGRTAKRRSVEAVIELEFDCLAHDGMLLGGERGYDLLASLAVSGWVELVGHGFVTVTATLYAIVLPLVR